jgi:hypothetical protein
MAKKRPPAKMRPPKTEWTWKGGSCRISGKTPYYFEWNEEVTDDSVTEVLRRTRGERFRHAVHRLLGRGTVPERIARALIDDPKEPA